MPVHAWRKPSQLNIGDIELGKKSGTLHIRKGKGSRERYTAIPLPARNALQAWLETRKKSGLGIRPESSHYSCVYAEIQESD